MTAKPIEKKVVAPVDGAIFHAGINERPLFEDKRARNVGDILTINIVEKTTGNRKASGSSSYSNSINANMPTITTNIPNKVRMPGTVSNMLSNLFSLNASIAGSTENKAANAGAGAASEDLTGTISVTVIDVLANGNLLVSGEKQVALNQSNEFIRFSGVVNPTTITNLNTVQSTQVADAHIEYKGAGAMNEVINDAQTLGFLGRFFMSVMPF
ncbi:MAG: flagellar basal body L-ring protein FlgH [Nitrosomonadales bacterium]|nr:flagellar basal body L-ring protein FlgH [Nitrosomonadales bacterium]